MVRNFINQSLEPRPPLVFAGLYSARHVVEYDTAIIKRRRELAWNMHVNKNYLLGKHPGEACNTSLLLLAIFMRPFNFRAANIRAANIGIRRSIYISDVVVKRTALRTGRHQTTYSGESGPRYIPRKSARTWLRIRVRAGFSLPNILGPPN